MKKDRILIIFSFLLFIPLVYAYPSYLDHQGILRNASTGELLNGSNYNITITLFNDSDVEKIQISEIQSLTYGVWNNIFLADESMFSFENPLYYIITINGTNLTRVNYTTVPYSVLALKANDSYYLGGIYYTDLFSNISNNTANISEIRGILYSAVENFTLQILALNTSYNLTENVTGLSNKIDSITTNFTSQMTDATNNITRLNLNIIENYTALNASINAISTATFATHDNVNANWTAISTAFGNWSSNYSQYYTIEDLWALGFYNDPSNLTWTQIATRPDRLTNFTNDLGIGNWTLNSSDYYTEEDIGAFGFYSSCDNTSGCGYLTSYTETDPLAYSFINNLTQRTCPAGEVSYGYMDNGTVMCVNDSNTLIDTTYIAYMNQSNNFTGNQTIDGNLSADYITATKMGITVNQSGGYPFYIYSPNGTGLMYLYTDTNYNSYLNIKNGTDDAKVLLHTNGNSYFVGGNVGIGTNNPTSTLYVEGNITGGLFCDNLICYNLSNFSTAIYNDDDSNVTELMTNSSEYYLTFHNDTYALRTEMTSASENISSLVIANQSFVLANTTLFTNSSLYYQFLFNSTFFLKVDADLALLNLQSANQTLSTNITRNTETFQNNTYCLVADGCGGSSAGWEGNSTQFDIINYTVSLINTTVNALNVSYNLTNNVTGLSNKIDSITTNFTSQMTDATNNITRLNENINTNHTDLNGTINGVLTKLGTATDNISRLNLNIIENYTALNASINAISNAGWTGNYSFFLAMNSSFAKFNLTTNVSNNTANISEIRGILVSASENISSLVIANQSFVLANTTLFTNSSLYYQFLFNSTFFLKVDADLALLNLQSANQTLSSNITRNTETFQNNTYCLVADGCGGSSAGWEGNSTQFDIINYTVSLLNTTTLALNSSYNLTENVTNLKLQMIDATNNITRLNDNIIQNYTDLNSSINAISNAGWTGNSSIFLAMNASFAKFNLTTNVSNNTANISEIRGILYSAVENFSTQILALNSSYNLTENVTNLKLQMIDATNNITNLVIANQSFSTMNGTIFTNLSNDYANIKSASSNISNIVIANQTINRSLEAINSSFLQNSSSINVRQIEITNTTVGKIMYNGSCTIIGGSTMVFLIC